MLKTIQRKKLNNCLAKIEFSNPDQIRHILEAFEKLNHKPKNMVMIYHREARKNPHAKSEAINWLLANGFIQTKQDKSGMSFYYI